MLCAAQVMGIRLHAFLMSYVQELCASRPLLSSVVAGIVAPSPSATSLSLHPSAVAAANAMQQQQDEANTKRNSVDIGQVGGPPAGSSAAQSHPSYSPAQGWSSGSDSMEPVLKKQYLAAHFAAGAATPQRSTHHFHNEAAPAFYANDLTAAASPTAMSPWANQQMHMRAQPPFGHAQHEPHGHLAPFPHPIQRPQHMHPGPVHHAPSSPSSSAAAPSPGAHMQQMQAALSNAPHDGSSGPDPRLSRCAHPFNSDCLTCVAFSRYDHQCMMQHMQQQRQMQQWMQQQQAHRQQMYAHGMHSAPALYFPPSFPPFSSPTLGGPAAAAAAAAHQCASPPLHLLSPHGYSVESPSSHSRSSHSTAVAHSVGPSSLDSAAGDEVRGSPTALPSYPPPLMAVVDRPSAFGSYSPGSMHVQPKPLPMHSPLISHAAHTSPLPPMYFAGAYYPSASPQLPLLLSSIPLQPPPAHAAAGSSLPMPLSLSLPLPVPLVSPLLSVVRCCVSPSVAPTVPLPSASVSASPPAVSARSAPLSNPPSATPSQGAASGPHDTQANSSATKQQTRSTTAHNERVKLEDA